MEPLPPTTITLHHIEGTKAGTNAVIDLAQLPGARLTMGRDPECILSFDPYRDPRVSARHADILLVDGQVYLEDRGSTNGTRINGVKIFDRTLLHPGDEIELGRKGSRIRFELGDTAGVDGALDEDALFEPLDAGKKPNRKKQISARRRWAERAGEEDAVEAFRKIPQPSGHLQDESRLRQGGAGFQVRHLADTSAHHPSKSLKRWLIVLTIIVVILLLIVIAGLVYLVTQQPGNGDDTASLTGQDPRLTGNPGEVTALQERVNQLESRLADWGQSQDATLRQMAAVDDELNRGRARITALIGEMESRVAAFDVEHPSASQVFQRVHRQYRESIFLIVTQVAMRDDAGQRFLCEGMGTGFLLTAEGHLVTCKHVVEPWKFGDIAVQMAREGLQLLPETYDVLAWPVGASALTPDGRMRTDTAHSLQQGGLSRIAGYPDRWIETPVPGLGLVRQHATDTSLDLSLLQLVGSGYTPLPLYHDAGNAPDAWRLQPLTPVMAVGFPEGLELLEGTTIESSPSPGSISKIEDTILISAPIIRGNSGGPVFAFDDVTGEARVIGIASRVSRESASVGICIKIDYALRLLPS